MDTLGQRVVWSLDYTCSVRQSMSDPSPRLVAERLGIAVDYDRALRVSSSGRELIEDVLVTNSRCVPESCTPPPGRVLAYPTRGWSVSEQFGPLGGPLEVATICGTCPANARTHRLAGCWGEISVDPDSVALNQKLTAILDRLGGESTLEECFQSTQPLWYGLWMRSPVPSKTLLVLECLIEELVDQIGDGSASESDLPARGELLHFLEGVGLAKGRALPLRVELRSPHRRVLDLTRIFPHCPHCKALACDQLWQREYWAALHSCSVCGVSFSPAECVETHRHEEREESLFKLLGSRSYQRLIHLSLKRQACEEDEAGRIAEAVTAVIEEEQTMRERFVTMQDRQMTFLEAHVYRGLCPVPPPASGVVEDAGVADGPDPDGMYWFDSGAFEEVLKRVRQHGLRVRYMTHVGATSKEERHAWDQIGDPETLFRQWKASGCTGKFSVMLIVPGLGARSEDKAGGPGASLE